MEKVLILQMHVGRGSRIRSRDHIEGIEARAKVKSRMETIKEKWMPSVVAWADRHGYDYECITELREPFQHPCTYKLGCCYDYGKEYDRVMWIDNDVEATDYAPTIPTEAGFLCGLAKRYGKTDNTEKYQTGIFIVDRQAAEDMYNGVFPLLNTEKEHGNNDQLTLSSYFHDYPRWVDLDKIDRRWHARGKEADMKGAYLRHWC